MADLEIGPQATGGFISPTPSFPKTAPVLEEIQRSTAETDATMRHAVTLLSEIEKQKQYDTDTEAYMEYKDKSSDLRDRLNTVSDLGQRHQQFIAGNSQILDDIKKKYPNISRVGYKSIESSFDADKRAFIAKSATDGAAQIRRNLSKFYDLSKRHGALAGSDAERDNVMNVFNQRVMNSGPLISSDEKDDWIAKLKMDISKEHLDMLAAAKPEDVLNMNPAEATKIGVLPSNVLDAQVKAATILSNRHNAAEASLQGQKEKNLEAAMANPSNTSQIMEWGRTNQLPGGMAQAEAITGQIGDKFEPNPGLTGSIVSSLISHPGSPTEFKLWFNETIRPQMYHMNPNDVSQIIGVYQTEAAERSTEWTNSIKDAANEVMANQHRLMGSDAYGVNFFSGKMKTDTVQHNSDVLRNANNRFREAKNTGEIDQIKNYFIDHDNQYYEKTWGTPAKPTAPTPATGGEIKRE